VGSDVTIPFDSRGFASTASGGTVIIRVTGTVRTDSRCVSRYGLVQKNGCLK
jgi:hypothetical protein